MSMLLQKLCLLELGYIIGTWKTILKIYYKIIPKYIYKE